MPLAYLYSRVSTPRRIDGLGLRRQAEERERWLAAHPELKLTIVENYADLGVSARGKSRCEGKLGLILERIADGTIPTGSYLSQLAPQSLQPRGAARCRKAHRISA